MTHPDPLDEELSHRRSADGENRLPPAIAVVVAAVAYALLPESLLLGPRLVIPIVELAVLTALIVTNPRRIMRQSRWSRIVAAVLTCLVIVANLAALGMLVASLISPSTAAGSLLVAAMQVWLTNVIGFGLLFWELDRGGPVARRKVRRDELPPADWRFSHDENNDAVVEVAVSSSEVRLGSDIHRLPLPVADQLQRLQSYRHDALDQPSEGPYGSGSDRCLDHLAPGHRSRRRFLRWGKLIRLRPCTRTVAAASPSRL